MTPDQNMPTVRWPLSAKIYAIGVGVPMIAISLTAAFWIFQTRFGGFINSRPVLAVLILMLAFAGTLVMAAWLFYIGVRRTITQEPEALIFAATGHLLSAIPAMVLLFVAFLRDYQGFVYDVQTAVAQRDFTLEFTFISWMLIHVYLALLLSFLDNTSHLLEKSE